MFRQISSLGDLACLEKQSTRHKAGLSERYFMRVADRPHRWEERELGLSSEQIFIFTFVPPATIWSIILKTKEKPLPGLDLEGLKGAGPWGQK